MCWSPGIRQSAARRRRALTPNSVSEERAHEHLSQLCQIDPYPRQVIGAALFHTKSEVDRPRIVPVAQTVNALLGAPTGAVTTHVADEVLRG